MNPKLRLDEATSKPTCKERRKWAKALESAMCRHGEWIEAESRVTEYTMWEFVDENREHVLYVYEDHDTGIDTWIFPDRDVYQV